MEDKEYYVINNIEEFTNAARILVFKNFGSSAESQIDLVLDSIKSQDKEEMDQVLTQEESIIIVKDCARTEKNKKTKKIRYIISDKIFMDMIESLNTRMVSNMLNNLVNKGKIGRAHV